MDLYLMKLTLDVIIILSGAILLTIINKWKNKLYFYSI